MDIKANELEAGIRWLANKLVGFIVDHLGLHLPIYGDEHRNKDINLIDSQFMNIIYFNVALANNSVSNGTILNVCFSSERME